VPDEFEPRFVDDNHGRSPAGPDDVLDHRPKPVVELLTQRRVLAVVLVATLAVGLGLGFLSGKHAAGSAATKTVVREVTAPPPAPSSGPFDQLIGLAHCSVQSGHQLQLGVEVRNELDVPVTLTSLGASDAAAGGQLRPVGSARGACGELPGCCDTDIAGYRLAVGASVWLTITLDVLTDCPWPLHLTFELSYTQAGRPATTAVGGFPDLGGVPYTGCH
jgi:hypothetical protein